MQSLLRSLCALSAVLLPLAVVAAPAPEASEKPAVVAHLGTAEGKDARTHVHVQLNRPDVTDVTVEIFDAQGVSLHTYALDAWQGRTYRPLMRVDIAPALAARVKTARVTAFSISTGAGEALFDTGMIQAQVNPCANQCDYTRAECHNDCFLLGCTGATYTCTGTPGNCVANCNCTGC